ncbi:hypothetical protein BT69DRAFT_877205 [Atractiella rhizophila]|nr:hypothetical protein BT69DRAFT_877205 [Atractiella rhizophila]
MDFYRRATGGKYGTPPPEEEIGRKKEETAPPAEGAAEGGEHDENNCEMEYGAGEYMGDDAGVYEHHEGEYEYQEGAEGWEGQDEGQQGVSEVVSAQANEDSHEGDHQEEVSEVFDFNNDGLD